jgi:hypothetical protein
MLGSTMADDDDTPIPGTTDSIKPWTLRAMPNEVRNMAIAIARDEGLTVSQWLERLIRHHVAGGPQHPPASGAPTSGGGRLDLIDLLREARALAQAPEVPITLKRSVFALSREAVRQARGLPPPAPRHRLAGPGSESPVRLATDESE